MYLLFTNKPEGNPPIGDGSFLMPTKCEEGWFVLKQHEQVCIDNGWTGYVEVEEVTFINYDLE